MIEDSSTGSPISPILSRFLELKKALGQAYRTQSHTLRSLEKFLSNHKETQELTPETFAQWCLTFQYITSGVRRMYMQRVRDLCLYRRRTEPSCFVPDEALFPPPHQPVQPYILNEDEVARLLEETQDLPVPPQYPLRREVFRLAIILLYTMGLRRGELLRLSVGDFDTTEGTLLVRASKFHKSRCLPMPTDVLEEVKLYIRARRAHRTNDAVQEPLLLSSVAGEGRGYTDVTYTIKILLKAAGIYKPNGRVPRIHDFRHSFAVNALLRWHRSGIDVQSKLPHLANYMGHVSIASTHYYLHFVEELASSTSARFAQSYGGLVTPTEKLSRGER